MNERIGALETALREAREVVWRVSQYDRMVIAYAGELQDLAEAIDAVLAGEDASQSRPFWAASDVTSDDDVRRDTFPGGGA